jgi:hypothetical protein
VVNVNWNVWPDREPAGRVCSIYAEKCMQFYGQALMRMLAARIIRTYRNFTLYDQDCTSVRMNLTFVPER